MRYFGANRTSFNLQARQGRSVFWVMLAGASVLFAGACSSDPKLTYDLSPAARGFSARGGHGQLAIAVPDATLPANSDGIVVRTGPQSVAYLTGAQWADKLPSLVQSRLIESFQNAHLLRAVGRPGILADATLHTALRRFELDAAQSAAAVEISAQLIGSSGRIIAGRLFSASVPALSSEPSAVAAALDAALRQVMREIVVWAAPKV
ncbi:MAG: ABC-type transport auxiliary lipoprotein family protein [Beijerinckiaceae bacterium]|nr:ABC-type transport auxiliary lipoprotein family protein [Beijerinckiaceae bacterium]MCI0736283.1 ABC-type transport auxiliary lipoprotein family protein [Beijerinckiaceae bacterium]